MNFLKTVFAVAAVLVAVAVAVRAFIKGAGATQGLFSAVKN